MIPRAASALLACAALTSSAFGQLSISHVGKGAGLNMNAFQAQFIELYNAGTVPVSLTGKSIQWASSAGSASWAKVDLVGTIPAGGYWLLRIPSNRLIGIPVPFADQDRPVGFNGLPNDTVTFGNTGGKVVLSGTTTLFTTNGCAAPDAANVIDLVSWDDLASTANCHEGSALALIPFPTVGPTGIGSTGVLRRCGGLIDTNDNFLDFVPTGRPPRTSTFTGAVDGPAVGGMTQVTGQADRGITTGYAGQAVLFSASLSTCSGTISSVSIDLSPVGGSALQALLDDGTQGDAMGGDGIYSFQYTIPAPPAAPVATHLLTITATDSDSRVGTGIATLTVAPTPPANDLCGNAEVIPATELPFFASATGNLVSAGPITLVGTPCTTNSGNLGTSRDVWYSFTPLVTADYTISTCNPVTAPGTFTSMSTNLTVFFSCPPDGATDLTGLAIACNANGCSNFIGGSPSTISSLSLSAGTTYLIRVAKAGSNTSIVGAPFRLDITSEPFGACCFTNGTCSTIQQSECTTLGGTFQGLGSTCSTTTCPPAPIPANDECTNAVVLTPGVSAPGTTFGATGADITTCDLTSWDLWYSYTPSSAGPFRITATRVSGAQTPAISIFASCPPVTDSNLACSVVPASGNVNTLEFEGVADTQYFIRVATNFSQRTVFSVVVDPVTPPCAGDFNDDGTLNSADFFDFLTAFFTAAPAADFNQDASVNSQDFFDFLVAFFTPCP